MAKKAIIQTEDDEEEFLLSKKAKRKLAKAVKASPSPVTPKKEEEQPVVDDTMSKVALMCQEMRWREAAILCQQAMAANQAEGQEEDIVLAMAYQKIEKSLRRQMAATFLRASREWIARCKEAGEAL